jgi:prepilin-type N-terminal cleavage/methylation domain-containing protein
MKRNAFTLVELIFVIVIIGVLAAVAVPKFKNLKQNAEVKAAIKTTIDTASSAASAAVNQLDLESNTTVQLSDLVNVKGKGWSYVSTDTNGTYLYNNPNGSTISTIRLNTDARTVYYGIDCDNFIDKVSKQKCYDDLNNTNALGHSGVEDSATISF